MKTRHTNKEAMFTWVDIVMLLLALIVLGFGS